jgi:hypothetical protein
LTVRVDAALDFRDALVVSQDHRGDRNGATDYDGYDRHEKSTQTDNRID